MVYGIHAPFFYGEACCLFRLAMEAATTDERGLSGRTVFLIFSFIAGKTVVEQTG